MFIMSQKSKINIVLLCAIGLLVLGGCGKRPSKVEQMRREKYVADSAALVAQQQSLVYYQSTLDSLLPKAQTFLNDRFCYEKNKAYEDHGHYVHRRLRTSYNAERNYVQTYITDDFRILVKLYSIGSRPLRPTQVTFSSEERYNVFTGSSHSFEQEQWHDILTLEDSSATAALHFIDIYRAEPISVRMQGQTSRTFRLSDRDKEALLDTYQLGCLMRDIHQLEKQIKQTNLEIQKYEHRINHRT